MPITAPVNDQRLAANPGEPLSFSGMNTKPCIHCGKEYEATREFFVYRNGIVENTCRLCRSMQVKAAAEKKAERHRRDLAKIEQRGLEVYAKAAALGGSNIPHSADVVERVVEYFGGVSGFASMLVKQFYDSQPGSSVRNKLLETICRLVQANVDSGGAKKPLTMWTEEELEAELNARFQQALLAEKGIVINAQALPAPGAEDTALDNDASEVGVEGTDERVEGTENGGAETLPADSPTGDDPSVPSE